MHSPNYVKELKKHYNDGHCYASIKCHAGREYIFIEYLWAFVENVHQLSWANAWNKPVKETYEIWIEIHCWSARKLPGVRPTYIHKQISQIKRMLHLFYLKVTQIRWTLRKVNGFIQKTSIIYSSRYLDSFDFSWICRRVLFIKSTFV